MSAKWLSRAAGALILVLAAWLRLSHLEVRPMHGDEAVHAIKLDELLRTGQYVYDPTEYHGPTLYYTTLPIAWFCNAHDIRALDERDLRIVPALFGLATVGLILSLRSALGPVAALAAAALAAVSPALVYYSRDYIQETLLAFFTLAAIAAGWRISRCPPRAAVFWAALVGFCIGLMHATKETCVIALGCAALALCVLLFLRPRAALAESRAIASHRAALRAAIATLCASATSALLFSNFGRNWAGVVDSLRTFSTYLNRANSGQVHDHPWDYYLGLLSFTHFSPAPVWSELGILLLAVIGASSALIRRQVSGHGGFIRFIAIYGILMTLVYSAIPYKTPWCAIQFLTPLTLLAGLGLTRILALCGRLKQRGVTLILESVVAVTFAGVLLHSAWQAWQASLNPRWVADNRNPYVYSQPLRDVENLAGYLERLAKASPQGHHTLVRVISDNPWPLPWHLRRFDRVGYWDAPPPDSDAPVVIVDSNQSGALRNRLKDKYVESLYGLRPREVLTVLVERDLYAAFSRIQSATGE